MPKLLVPIDFSSCSIAALKQAAALARGGDTSLIVLYVVESGSLGLVPELTEETNVPRQEVKLLLRTLSEGTPPIPISEQQVEGVPVSTIIAVAEEEKADLIVMGTTGRTGLKRFVLGSVAEEVIRRAPCPVLALRADSVENEKSAAVSMQNWRLPEPFPSMPTEVDLFSSEEINRNPTLALISRAIAARASDIHIDPMGQEFNVRLRVDGRLVNYCRLSSEVGRALVMQLKVTANLDIADPFHAKEGRLTLPASLQDFEVRITTVPVIDGEAISLRVLGRHRLMRAMEQLGLSSDAQSRINRILRHGEGLVLVTGPTGSGKTTTLYSMLHALDDGTRNIVTIEDPVEYDIPTFRQLPVDVKHGITMTNGLRTLLRLDPDVVLVGEIRDAEAAETAMRAASSGKYVFSSLHTRDVASTVTALRDLHIDNRSLSGNLAGIVSQRLVRRLCQDCRRAAKPTEIEAAAFLASEIPSPENIYHPVGCPRCRGTGFFDRIGVFEVMTSDDEIMNAIEVGKSEAELRHLIRAHGVCTLEKDALRKVAEGLISLEETGSMTTIELERQSVETRPSV